MTRAFHQLSHGHLQEAIELNCLSPAVFLAYLLVLLADVVYLATGFKLTIRWQSPAAGLWRAPGLSPESPQCPFAAADDGSASSLSPRSPRQTLILGERETQTALKGTGSG